MCMIFLGGLWRARPTQGHSRGEREDSEEAEPTGGSHSEGFASGGRHCAFSLAMFMVALLPPDLLGGPGIPRVGPPGLATPGETETGQKEGLIPRFPSSCTWLPRGGGHRGSAGTRLGTVFLPPAPLAWSSHSHVRGLLGSSPPGEGQTSPPKCKIGRWPCSSWINTNKHCQADCKLPTNLLSPHKHKSLCVHQDAGLPVGPGPDPCAFQLSTRVLYT